MNRDELARQVYREYEQGVAFKQQLDLYENVRCCENFYLGKQWEGVQSNGLPTPVFNFIKRIVLFLVASTATDSIKLNATALQRSRGDSEALCGLINRQFDILFEQGRLGRLTRQFMRNAAVDGDACLYSWFDPEGPEGGCIRTEILENTRVIFGDPCDREVDRQPYVLLPRRMGVDQVRRRCRQWGGQEELVTADPDQAAFREGRQDGEDKCTLILRLWRDEHTGTIHACECTPTAVVRPAWDTEQRRYPIVWMSWDYVPDCYHGQGAVTGLIPNQIFVNKIFAMTMISLMTTAYPKIVYDRTRVARWDSRVGAAIPVNGGDVANVARAVDAAAISPQISQFIELAVRYTKEFMGATDAALGDVRPDNTSAIIALQKSSSVPLELVRQNFFQCLEDLGRIWLDLMRVYYGVRPVCTDEGQLPVLFDFAGLDGDALALKLDVGGSAYWSEIAQMNTLDNLLARGQIHILDYLERIPRGYISNQQQLIDKLRREQEHSAQPMLPGQRT